MANIIPTWWMVSWDLMRPIGGELVTSITSPSCWGTHFLYLSNPPSGNLHPIIPCIVHKHPSLNAFYKENCPHAFWLLCIDYWGTSMSQLEKSSEQPAAQMRTYQERSRDMFDYYIFWECSAARVCSVLASRVLRVTRSAWRLWLIKTHCVYTPTIIQHQL